MAVRMGSELRREQLLDVTKAIAGGRGLHAVTIDGVARAAGVSRPIVYEHFGSLQGLLEALVRRESTRALGQLQAVLAPVASANPSNRLVDALRAYLVTVREDPATWSLVLMPPEGTPPPLRSQMASGRDRVAAQLAEAARVGPGHHSPDPELSTRVMAAVADESARLLLADPEHYPIKRLIAHVRWLLGLVPLAAA